MMNNYRLIFLWAALLFLIASCRQINNAFKDESPRQTYKQKIEQSPLASKTIVQQWVTAGDLVLRNPVSRQLPFQTKQLYFSDESNAWAWQFSMQEGQTLQAKLTRSDSTYQLFMDLFSVETGTPHLVEFAKDSVISFTAEQSGSFILRLQAELLINGSATLILTNQPSLAFPVQGGIHADIGGVFGDPRDGGARKHKGVDIFADRGTPALAVANGRVSRTGNHGLGGKQVWLHANGKSIYYAHLNSIKSHAGQKVETGDTLGFVGNTGNARTSPPHLHFGIYAHGAINPQPFIDFTRTGVEPISADPSTFPKWGRISTARANVRPLPSTVEKPVKSLIKDNAVQVIGGTGDWYQISLPNNTTGFIYRRLIEPATKSIHTQKIRSSEQFYAKFHDPAPIFSLDSLTSIPVLGTYKNRFLTRYKNHWLWVKK